MALMPSLGKLILVRPILAVTKLVNRFREVRCHAVAESSRIPPTAANRKPGMPAGRPAHPEAANDKREQPRRRNVAIFK